MSRRSIYHHLLFSAVALLYVCRLSQELPRSLSKKQAAPFIKEQLTSLLFQQRFPLQDERAAAFTY